MKITRFRFAAATSILLTLSSCTTVDRQHHVIVSVREQRLALLDKGTLVATYPVSTSKFAIGDWPGSRATPLGELEIAQKIGAGLPLGTVLKDRRPTGEILPPDAPGRDPIVTRILWLRGREAQNANAYSRYIYIHGTPEERNIGRPASYGCIRMRSRDVVQLFDIVGRGAQVSIVDAPLETFVPGLAPDTRPVATNAPRAGMVIR
jgi:lipoprotein-anchoring transpeptidase ErfK/SrfK